VSVDDGGGACGAVTSPASRLEAILVEAERIAHLGSYEWDVQSNSVYRSDELCRIYGLAREEFKPSFEGYLERVHPEDHSRTRGIIENAYRERIPFEFEERIVRPDGSIRMLLSQGKWIFDAGGNPVKLIGVCLDITESKFAAGLLSAEKQVLECIARRLPLGHVLNEICRRIEQINPPVVSSILLLESDGKRMRPAAAPSLPEYWARAITPLESGPEAGRETVVAADITQDPRWTSHPDYLKIALECGFRACWSTPILSAKGELLGTLALYYKERREPLPRDLDLIKQATNLASIAIKHERAMEGLQRARDEMEKRVQDRTAELAVVNHELEAFASAVSHDLRSPLRRIVGLIDFLLEDCADNLKGEARNCLDIISGEARRMESLVNALFKLSQATHGELRKEKVDLSQLASEIQNDLRRQHPERAVEFVVASGVCARGDPVLIRAALQNLLDNAWKFTAKTARARIEFGVSGLEGPVYFIRDNGAGFDNKFAARLFAPFQRLHSAEDFPGTGIGLATVQQIILRHGGRIWAEGAPDKGATFFFTLP
jgi:PAS domain S-box-containing protein